MTLMDLIRAIKGTPSKSGILSMGEVKGAGDPATLGPRVAAARANIDVPSLEGYEDNLSQLDRVNQFREGANSMGVAGIAAPVGAMASIPLQVAYELAKNTPGWNSVAPEGWEKGEGTSGLDKMDDNIVGSLQGSALGAGDQWRRILGMLRGR